MFYNARWRSAHSAKFCRTIHKQHNAQSVIVHIPKSNVFRFGDSNNASPIFRDLEWTVNEGENWAIISMSGSQKAVLFQVRMAACFIFVISCLLAVTALFRGPRRIFPCTALTLSTDASRTPPNITFSTRRPISFPLTPFIGALARSLNMHINGIFCASPTFIRTGIL